MSLLSYLEDDSLVALVANDEKDGSLLGLVEISNKDTGFGRLLESHESEKVKSLVSDYVKGVPVVSICSRYEISSGQLRTHLDKYGIPLRVVPKNSVEYKVCHLTEQDKLNLIEDYKKGFGINNIYKKYHIHKNGVYHILDSYRVERKIGSRKKKEKRGKI